MKYNKIRIDRDIGSICRSVLYRSTGVHKIDRILYIALEQDNSMTAHDKDEKRMQDFAKIEGLLLLRC